MTDNKKLVIEYFNCCNKNDADAIADQYAPDGVHVVMGRTKISGTFSREQMRSLSRNILIAFPSGMKFEIKSLMQEGDTVCCEIETFAKHANGKEYNNHYAWIFVFQDGLIKSSKEYLDTQHMVDIMLTEESTIQRIIS